MSSVFLLLAGIMFSDVTEGFNPQLQAVWVADSQYVSADIRGMLQSFDKGGGEYTAGAEVTVFGRYKGVLLGGGWEGARLENADYSKSASRPVAAVGFDAGPTRLLLRYLWPDGSVNETRGFEVRFKFDSPEDRFVVEGEIGQYDCIVEERDRFGQLLNCPNFSGTAIRFGWRF